MKRLTPHPGEDQLTVHLKKLPAARKRAITNSLNRLPTKTFASKLLKWFDKHGRKALPWQHNPTPYRVWISEIMLQQTQVSTVIPYFERFMAAFPDVSALAAAHEDTVLHHWAGLGYYARARNLHKAAKMICAEYNGDLPITPEALISLPGIGQSTAGAIISLSSNRWAPILDGNVKRVLARVHRVRGPIQETAVQHHLWALSHHYTPSKAAKAFNQGMMDIGATICTRTRPNCAACPFETFCSAHRMSQTHQFPEPKNASPKPTRSSSFLMLISANTYAEAAIMLEKRPNRGIWGGLWGFPEFERNDVLFAFVKQHLPKPARQQKKLSDNLIVATAKLPPIRHIFTHFTLQITPVVITVDKRHNNPLGADYARITQWFPLNALPSVGLAAPVAKLLKQLQKRHLGQATKSEPGQQLKEVNTV